MPACRRSERERRTARATAPTRSASFSARAVAAAALIAARAVAAAALVLSACAGAPRTGTEAPAPPAAIVLETSDGDVWAFARVIEGTGAAACDRVELARVASGGRVIVEASREGDRFRARVPLREGENVLRARCVIGARASESEPVRWRVRLEERPRALVRVVPEGAGVVVDLGGSERAPAGTAPLVGFAWSSPAAVVGLATTSGAAPLLTAGGAPLSSVSAPRVALALPARDGEYVVTGEVIDAAGARDRASARFVVEGGVARVVDPVREHAAWIDGAVIYGAVPFLFGRPGLPAITARLDALHALGVDTIWLAPITDSPEDDYGYAVTDYFEVRQAYGTREDLRALVSEAHARGMRVVMDFVPNHTSDQHPYFEHARAHGERSPYWGFYERDAGGEPEHYFDWENLPNLDYDHPEVRAWMGAAFAFWAREMDVDGFRVDAAWGVEQRAPEALAEIARDLYRIDPDLLLIAEASACDPYWERAGFAAGYDWTSTIGLWAWHGPLGIGGDDPGVDVPALRGAIAASVAPRCARVVRFLDNNDTGMRFLTRMGRPLHDAALTLLFTLPGIPALFTGAEIGAEYLPYERQAPLEWQRGEGHARESHARELARRIALRRALPALRDGELVMLDAAPADAVLAFARWRTESPVLVVIELGGTAREATLRLPGELAAAFSARTLHDALAAADVEIRHRGEALVVPIEPHAARVLLAR